MYKSHVLHLDDDPMGQSVAHPFWDPLIGFAHNPCLLYDL